MPAPGSQDQATKEVKPSRHGLCALKARVKLSGFSAIDKRSAGAQALMAWRRKLLSDLGGEASISTQRETLIELAVRTRLYVDHVDCYLLSQPSLINRKKKSVLPVVRERQGLVDCLARLLGQLGLDRQALPAPTLQQYIASKESHGN